MFCLILISHALNHLPVGEEERNHLLLTEYRVQQSQDFTLRTLHLFHWSLLSSHLRSKPVISHTNSKKQTKMFACPRRELSFFSMKSPLHISAIGWGTIIRTVKVGETAAPWAHWGRSYKLGITLVIVHLVEALEHVLLMTCKRSESMQRVCTGSLERQPLTCLDKHRSRVQIYWQIKLPLMLIKHLLTQSTLKGNKYKVYLLSSWLYNTSNFFNC